MNIQHKVLNANRMVWRRRKLRSKSTDCELMLWEKLRNSKVGVKFKRQYSIMNYVVDFYCHKAKLAIEIDGSIHDRSKNRIYDKYRTEYIHSLGVKEIRFSNYEVLNNLNEVVAKIISCVLSPEIRREK